WRDSRNSALAKPFGWLSVVGLHWLDQESTWPEAPGTFTVEDGWVTIALEPGIKAGPAAETFDLMSESQTDATTASTGVAAPSRRPHPHARRSGSRTTVSAPVCARGDR